MKRSLSLRFLSLLFFCIFLVSLLPIAYIATFNHACYDDFGFSILTHNAWRETGSFLATLQAAWQNTVGIRNTWEGTYATSFLSALQPALFSPHLYWITTLLLLGMLLFSFWVFLRALCKTLQITEKGSVLLLFSLVGLLAIQFAPSASEGFFWFNGGVAYTFFWSVGLWRLSLWLCPKRYTFLGLWVLSLIMGGSKYPTAHFFLLCDLPFLFFLFKGKKTGRYLLAVSTLLLLGGLLFSAFSPGNAVRAQSLGTGAMHPIKAILQALYFGFSLMSTSFTLPVVVLIALGCYMGYHTKAPQAFWFRYPWLVAMGAMLLYCAQCAPTLYMGNYLGNGRVLNTYHYTYLFGWLAVSTSVGGYLRNKLRDITPTQGIRLGIALAFSCVLLVGGIGYQPDGAESWGPQHTTSGSALRSLYRGQAQTWHQAMQARETALLDPTLPEVTLSPVPNAPPIFMGDILLSPPNLSYVLSLYGDYFQKEAVYLE